MVFTKGEKAKQISFKSEKVEANSIIANCTKIKLLRHFSGVPKEKYN